MPRKERVSPGLGIAPDLGRPGVKAPDPFVQFTGNAPSQPLRDLARSLSRFGEQGARFATQLQRQKQERDTEAGRQAFLKALEEQKDTAKALGALKMLPQQSKWYRFGVQSAAGKQDAMRARDHFFATSKDAIDEADTLEQFDQIAADALDAYRKDGEFSEAFDNGFFPSYMALIENARYNFAMGIDGKLNKQRIDDFQAESMSAARLYLSQGGEPAGLGGEFTRQLDEVFDAENPKLMEAMQEAIVENLKALAEDQEDSSILDIAKTISIGQTREDGTRLTLYDRYSQGSDGLSAARAGIISKVNARYVERETIQLRLDKVELEEIEDNILTAITEGGRGSYTSSQEIERLLKRADSISSAAGGALRQVITSRESFADNTVTRVYDSILTDIWQGEGNANLIIGNMGSLSSQAARQLHSELQAYQNSQKAGTAEHTVFEDPRIMDYVNGVTSRFGTGPMGSLTADKGNRAAVAKAQLRQVIARNAEAVLAMSLPERETWLAQQQDIVINRQLGGLQGQLGGTEGVEATPMQSGPVRVSTDAELDAAFNPTDFVRMEEWMGLYNGDITQGLGDPAISNFALAWDRMKPDAPVGSAEFVVEWMRLRDRKEAQIRPVVIEDPLPTPTIDTLSGQ